MSYASPLFKWYNLTSNYWGMLCLLKMSALEN